MFFSQETIFQFVVLVILFYLLSPGTIEKITRDSQEQSALIRGVIFALVFMLISKFVVGEDNLIKN